MNEAYEKFVNFIAQWRRLGEDEEGNPIIPLYCAKMDVAKAFDSIVQEKLNFIVEKAINNVCALLPKEFTLYSLMNSCRNNIYYKYIQF